LLNMETVLASGESDLASLNSEELKRSYHSINTRLAKNLLGGASFRDQENDIRMLNKISAELNRRKAFSGPVQTTRRTMSS
jgi:hypothetical protein